MGVATKYINGALVYYDEAVTHRIVDAIGPDVVKFTLNAGTDISESNGPFVFTKTDVGAGDSTLTRPTNTGDMLVLTTANTDYDGVNVQLGGELLKLASGKPVYLGVKGTLSDATNTDLLIGLFELQTALLATGGAHAVGGTIAGVGFVKLSGSTTINGEAYVTNAETGQVAVATAETTGSHWYELVWDGSTLYYYFDGTLAGSLSSGLPTTDLTLSLNHRTGEGNSNTFTIQKMNMFYFG